MRLFIYSVTLLLGMAACNGNASKQSSASAGSTNTDTSPKVAQKPEMPETALGWQLGSGSYGFKEFTFFEALDKIDSCGLTYVEGFPDHVIGGGIEEKLDYHMDAATRDKVLAKLNEKGIKMNAYGVISPDNEEDWRTLFEFGKAMGIETFSSEPDPEFIPLISGLCDEYGIKVAIHNHAEPSPYWNPDRVLSAIEGQSDLLGAAADVGHWLRSGLDPIACLKQLEGHLFHMHMKDLNEKSKEAAHDVPWGTGVINMDGIIAELKRQGFKGSISAEYEYNWHNSVPDIQKSIVYFRNAINEE